MASHLEGFAQEPSFTCSCLCSSRGHAGAVSCLRQEKHKITENITQSKITLLITLYSCVLVTLHIFTIVITIKYDYKKLVPKP